MSDLLKLLLITKKRELEKHCQSAVIHSNEFVELILHCKTGLMPWQHQIRRQEFQPEHLQLSKEENAVLGKHPVGSASKEANKIINKIATMFEERRLLVGHMFVTLDISNWHFFYFDQRDRSDRKNHWKAGAHIHLMNHVMLPKQDARTVWEGFCSGTLKLRGEHVRFRNSMRD
jgi:hypothetical protein